MRFSVIVPIYNVEKYLAECIDSVLKQSFTDFELILVDDGSPDGCGKICDEYAAKDSRITVIHKENGGLVSARKAGIKAASGEYVICLDSDDKIAPEMLGRANEITEKHNPDLISFAIKFFDESSSYTAFENVPAGLYSKSEIKSKIYPKVLMAENMEHMFYYLCAKVIRRKILIKPQLAVDNAISLGEDVSCLMQVYPLCERICVSDYTAYLCRQRPGSDSRSFRPVQFAQLKAGVRLLDGLKTDNADFKEQTDRYTAFICFGLLNAAALSDAGKSSEQIENEILSEPLFTHIKRAQFKGVSAKMRIVYRLMKKRKILAAYLFLKICNFLKGR